MTNIDIHHNLMMNNNLRMPAISNKSSRMVNNIVYNYYSHGDHNASGVNVDLIGNLYKKGPLNVHAMPHEFQTYGASWVTNDPAGDPSLYMLGNKGWNQTNPAGDQWLMHYQVAGPNGQEMGPIPAGWRRTVPLANTAFPIVAEPSRKSRVEHPAYRRCVTETRL